MMNVDERARRVLTALALQPTTGAASGRYLRSRPIRPGVRYWATSQPRYEQDAFGVQFFGEAVSEAERLGSRLTQAGFAPRTPQSNQRTFARAIPYRADQSLDIEAAQAARAALDAILSDLNVLVSSPSTGTGGFRALMLASPLSGVDLPEPDRAAPWRVAP